MNHTQLFYNYMIIIINQQLCGTICPVEKSDALEDKKESEQKNQCKSTEIDAMNRKTEFVFTYFINTCLYKQDLFLT